MPFSANTFDREIEMYFKHVEQTRVLDVGAGEGKYGRMLRKIKTTAWVGAIEIDADYVRDFKLRELYDQVMVCDASALLDQPNEVYSTVVIGDCIEHMRKSAGVDLVNFLVYRADVLIMKFPLQMEQNSVDGHPSEAHRSVWTGHDFAAFDHIYREMDDIAICFIRGYPLRKREWLPAELVKRFGYASLNDYYAANPDRAAMSVRRATLDPELSAVLPATCRFIVVDAMSSRLHEAANGRAIPFLEQNGEYWGNPADGKTAVAELERLCRGGAAAIVFTDQCFWWLEHYPELKKHLESAYRRVLDNDRWIVFDLRSAGAADRRKNS